MEVITGELNMNTDLLFRRGDQCVSIDVGVELDHSDAGKVKVFVSVSDD